MAQTWAANAVVETGTFWSNGANTYSDNSSYAVCDSADAGGTSGYLKLGLPNNSDPLDHTSHVLLVNCKNSSGSVYLTGSVQVTVELRESGTLRASYSFINPGTTDTDKTYTLSTAEAAAISNYNNLEIWVKVAFSAGAEDGITCKTFSLDYAKLTTPSLAVPGVPTNVAATDGTYTDKTRVTWTAPSSSPGSAATSYKIYRNTTNNSGSATLIASGDTASPYDDTTGVSGTTYYYWVKATNGAGDSAFSSSNSGYRLAPPDAPTGVPATDGTYTDKVRVTWNASSGATSYKIYRHTADSIPASPSWTGITATTYDDTTASDNVTYYYWVKATNSEGDSPASSSNSGYRLDVPAVPTNLAATDGTHADKVALTWTASPTASSYKIYRNTIDSIPGSPLASGVVTTSYDDTSATLDVVYYYWVVAVNANGDSAPTASEAGYASAGGVTATVTACIADAVVTVGNVVIPQPNRIWRDIFTTYNPSSSTFHVGMVEMEHTPTPGSGEYSAINAHHFTLSLEDLALHHFVYDDTFPSAFASTTAFTTSERGGAYLDRPESIVAGFWSWGSHPTYNRYPAALLYELSLPYSDEIAPNAAGYPSYVEGSPSQDCWVILPATDYGMVGTLKTLRRVGVWLIPAPDVNDLSIVEVTVIPHPVNAQGGTAEAITETASATGYTAGVTPFQPTRYVYVDFDPSTNPGVSGSVCGEAFEIKIKLTGGIGIRRVMVEVDMGGDIDTVDSQSN